VLSFLLPGWEECRGVEQNPYHHLDVLEHSLACVAAMEALIINPDTRDMAGPALAQADLPLLKTAALLHDMGKPPTAQAKSPGWNTFYRHDKLGALLARNACLNLGLGPNQANTVARLVGGHMEPHHLLWNCSSHPRLRPRYLKRFLYRHEHDAQALMLMAQADNMAGQGPGRPEHLEENFMELWRELNAMAAAAPIPPPLLNGRQVMEACSLSPGPEVGRLLRRLRHCQLDEDLQSREQALSLVKSWARGGAS
jgi:putative nucleotidyltransferase with HDIG domain